MEVDLDEVMGATKHEMSSQDRSALRRILEEMKAVNLAFAEKVKIKEEWEPCMALRAASREALKTENKTKKQMIKNLSENEVLIEKAIKMTANALLNSTRTGACTMDLVVLSQKLCLEKSDLAESLRLRVAKLEQERDEREKKADSLQLQLQEAMEVDASRRVQMATLEQQLQNGANQDKEAKTEADSLRVQILEKTKLAESLQLQLQEAMEVDSSRRVHMATLEQQLQERANQAKEVEESLRFQLREEMMKCRSLHSQVAMLEEENEKAKQLGKELPFHKFI